MAGIDYTLGMKTSGFNAGVSGALGKLADLGTKVAAVTATAGLAAGAGIGALIAKSIGKAAEMETLQTAFAPLIGGFEEARVRMEELSKFAAKTDFDIPGVAQASKNLEKATKGTLSTGEGLRMVGDAASFAQVPIEEMATHVARLYAGLEGGGEIGEAMQRLTELNVISYAAKSRIMELNQTVGGGAAAWALARKEISQFSGSMEMQSVTWAGKMRNLSDSISQVMAKFGMPIMDALKPYLDGVIVKVESLADFGVRMGEKIGKSLELAFAAFQSGNAFEAAGAALKLGFLEATNVLAKNLRAAIAAATEAFKVSGVLAAVELTFTAIGLKLSAVLDRSTANFAEMIGRVGMAVSLREGADNQDKGAGYLFNAARNQMGNIDLGESFSAFTKKFNEQIATLPDAIDTSEAAEEYEKVMEPIRKLAADMAAQREKLKQEMDAKMKNRPQANGADTTTPAAAPAEGAARTGSTSRPTADRLAQIGGYVGGAASGLAQRAAEKTASYMEKAVVRLTSIDRRLTQSQPAGVFL
jgi:hypothetical protein